METAMKYFARQRNQQLNMWKELFSAEDALDKMCKTSVDASLMSVAYSLAMIADSLKVLSESMEESDED